MKISYKLINIFLILLLVILFSLLFYFLRKDNEFIIVNDNQHVSLKTSRIIDNNPPPRPQHFYDMVVKKNLFSPDRKGFTPKVEDKQTEATEKQKPKITDGLKISGKEIELYAIIISNSVKKSLLLDNSQDKQGKTNSKKRWVEVGDKIANLTVTEIEKDQILVKGNGTVYKVKLRAKKKSRSLRQVVRHPVTRVKNNVVSVKTGNKGKANPEHANTNKKKTKVIHTPFGDIIKEL